MLNYLLYCFQEAVHRQGQIVGPDVLNVQADRIEAPIGQRQDQLQGQLPNDNNMNVPLADNDERGAGDEDQVSI